MEQSGYFWARLNADQLAILQEAERTLGAETDLLLAYEPVRAEMGDLGTKDSGLRVAQLGESQVDCLQGLEKKLGALVIAYRQAG